MPFYWFLAGPFSNEQPPWIAVVRTLDASADKVSILPLRGYTTVVVLPRFPYQLTLLLENRKPVQDELLIGVTVCSCRSPCFGVASPLPLIRKLSSHQCPILDEIVQVLLVPLC